jgi:hypothetical protein
MTRTTTPLHCSCDNDRSPCILGIRDAEKLSLIVKNDFPVFSHFFRFHFLYSEPRYCSGDDLLELDGMQQEDHFHCERIVICADFHAGTRLDSLNSIWKY